MITEPNTRYTYLVKYNAIFEDSKRRGTTWFTLNRPIVGDIRRRKVMELIKSEEQCKFVSILDIIELDKEIQIKDERGDLKWIREE